MSLDNMSLERTMLVGSALEGLLSAKMFGPGTYGPDAIAFYSSQSVKLADATMEIMDPKIPIVPPTEPAKEILEKIAGLAK